LLKRNWQVYGIEPSEARRIARQNGINNIYSDLFKAHFEGNFFDVIRFNWSFEHIHNPTQTILECRRILKKDGRLIMFLPNYNGITYKIFPQCVEIPVHLYYWTTDTFLRLCKKTNFEVVDYYTFSYPLLFLFACELMGRNDICSYFKKDFKRFSSLKTFLDLAGQENMGDDMGFT
jgi:SAM-dependent methyltransferase